VKKARYEGPPKKNGGNGHEAHYALVSKGRERGDTKRQEKTSGGKRNLTSGANLKIKHLEKKGGVYPSNST